MSVDSKLVALAILILTTGCAQNARTRGSFGGDTLLQICVTVSQPCLIEVMGEPSHTVIAQENVSAPKSLHFMNPEVNLDDYIEIHATCGGARKLIGRARVPGALTPGVCVVAEAW
jgi:hypothetical protein